MYLAINILLANDLMKFSFTVSVLNLRDVAGSCEAWEAVIAVDYQ
jgi:hypothetical protein